MKKAGKINSISPEFAVPGGELTIECSGFQLNSERDFACYIGGEKCRIVGASAERVLAIVPERSAAEPTLLQLVSGGESGEPVELILGRKLVGDMHMVGNPAIDPTDDSIILTRSGSRWPTASGNAFSL